MRNAVDLVWGRSFFRLAALGSAVCADPRNPVALLRFDRVTRLLPGFEAAVEDVDIFKPMVHEAKRRTDAGCFMWSRAISDKRAVGRYGLHQLVGPVHSNGSRQFYIRFLPSFGAARIYQ